MSAATTFGPRGYCGALSSSDTRRLTQLARSTRRSATSARPRRSLPRVTAMAAQQEDEFAVFRFTLGIPGFDDQDIPRVVGLLGASLLAVNHFLAASNPGEAQSRTELIGAALSAACVVTPTIGRRLTEANAGVSGGTLDVAGGEQVFAMAPHLGDAAKSDVAWGTFALLTQTNAQGAILHRAGSGGDGGGGVLCARGSVRLPTTGTGVLPGSPASIITALSASVSAASGMAGVDAGAGAGTGAGGEGAAAALYYQDRSAIDRAGANEWGFLPQGVESVLVQPAGEGGATRLVLVSDKPRAFSKKQRAWIAAIADKLAGVNVSPLPQ